MNETKVPENKAYKVTLIVLVGLAAFSTAIKDLNRLQEIVSSVREFTSQSRGTEVAMLNVDSIPANESCPNDSPEINASTESGSSNDNAQASGIEIERIVYDEPEIGGNVELVSSRKVNRNVPNSARAKYALAKNLKAEISAKHQDGNWPAHFEFKTSARTVTLDLPVTMLTNIKAEALEAELSRDLPLSLLGRINRKQSHGKTDNVRREVIKRLERSYGSRRAS